MTSQLKVTIAFTWLATAVVGSVIGSDLPMMIGAASAGTLVNLLIAKESR